MASSLRLVLFGPPGAGKGTQAQLLKDRLGIEHISSGDVFRFHIQEQTELGRQVSHYYNQGLLVPDELGLEIIMDRILEIDTKAGFILDGFPRTREQAKALDEALQERSRGLDKVLLVDVPEAELVRRLGGRFLCQGCRSSHNLEQAQFASPPACDRCGGELYQREDDRAEAVQVRIGVYREQTAPVLDFYREEGLLVEISGVGAIEEINRNALEALSLDTSAQIG